MRTLLAIALVTVSALTLSVAQENRWTRASNPGVTSSSRLAASSSGIYLLSDKLHFTASQGRSWSPCTGISGTVAGVFTLNVGVTIAVANVGQDSVRLFYSLSGLNWEPLDTLRQTGPAAGIGAVGNEYMVALRDGRVFKRTETAWVALMKAPVTDAQQFITTSSILVLASTSAIAISTDVGTTWTSVNTAAAKGIANVRELNGQLYVASASGVYSVDRSTNALRPIGSDKVGPTVAAEGYLNSLFAVGREAFGSEVRRRLYRFNSADATWLAMADTLPGDIATVPDAGFDKGLVDAGRIVFIHATGDTATSGVYYVDLNVVTSVNDATPGIASTGTSDVIDTGIPATDETSVTVTDLMGRQLSITTDVQGTVRLRRQDLPRHPIAVTVQSPAGQVSRRLVMP